MTNPKFNSIFLSIIDFTQRNHVLQCFIEGREMDYTAKDISTVTGLSLVTSENIIHELAVDGFIFKSRIVNRCQLYQLSGSKHAKLLCNLFDEAIK